MIKSELRSGDRFLVETWCLVPPPPMSDEIKTLDDVRNRAREKLKGICAVYPSCDGDKDRLCQKNENYGKPIGLGGAGSGQSFAANIAALERVRLHTRVVGDHFQPDMSFDFFGTTLDFPVMGASTSGMSSYNGAITELDFCRVTLEGCKKAGTLSWRGDTFFYDPEAHFALQALQESSGRGVPIFKPRGRAQDVLIRLIRRAEEIGCPAVGIDLDGCGSTNFARAGTPVYRKSMKDLEALVKSTKLPFIAKGIMHPQDAKDVISDGAKGVLIGRDNIRAAIGGGELGVKLQMDRLRQVLSQTMVMTGCKNLSEIGRNVIS